MLLTEAWQHCFLLIPGLERRCGQDWLELSALDCQREDALPVVLESGREDSTVVGFRLRSTEFDSVCRDENARNVAYVLRGSRKKKGMGADDGDDDDVVTLEAIDLLTMES